MSACQREVTYCMAGRDENLSPRLANLNEAIDEASYLGAIRRSVSPQRHSAMFSKIQAFIQPILKRNKEDPEPLSCHVEDCSIASNLQRLARAS